MGRVAAMRLCASLAERRSAGSTATPIAYSLGARN